MTPNEMSLRWDGNRAAGAVARPWTAVEKHKLKGLIEQGLSASKIARTLRRPLSSITVMAIGLGLPLK